MIRSHFSRLITRTGSHPVEVGVALGAVVTVCALGALWAGISAAVGQAVPVLATLAIGAVAGWAIYRRLSPLAQPAFAAASLVSCSASGLLAYLAVVGVAGA